MPTKEFNAQNVPRAMRDLWIPRVPGNKILIADWVQIEAGITAFFARDEKMTEVMLDPKQDIHAINTATLFKGTSVNDLMIWNNCDRAKASHMLDDLIICQSKETAKRLKIWFNGEIQSARQCTKPVTHGIAYGQMPPGMAAKHLLTVRRVMEFFRLYYEKWPRIKDWQLEEEERCYIRKIRRNPWNRPREFWAARRYLKDGSYRWDDREKCLAFLPASSAGEMFKYVFARIPEHLLYTVTHDSFALEVAPDEVTKWAVFLKDLMSTRFPEMTWEPYYPEGFFCRVEIEVGDTWAGGTAVEV